MNHDINQTCANCYHWVGPKNADDATGFCCFNPPALINRTQANFPTTGPNNWCGQWTAVPTQIAAQKPASPKVPRETKSDKS